MRELLEFLLTKIVGKENFSIAETEDVNFSNFSVKVDPNFMGIVIGKGGKTIRNLRTILKVRATLERRGVALTLEDQGEKGSTLAEGGSAVT